MWLNLGRRAVLIFESDGFFLGLDFSASCGGGVEDVVFSAAHWKGRVALRYVEDLRRRGRAPDVGIAQILRNNKRPDRTLKDVCKNFCEHVIGN